MSENNFDCAFGKCTKKYFHKWYFLVEEYFLGVLHPVFVTFEENTSVFLG